MSVYAINYKSFRLHELTEQTFRCGKTVTTAVLREIGGDTEVSITTTKDWKQVIGATYLRD